MVGDPAAALANLGWEELQNDWNKGEGKDGVDASFTKSGSWQ